MELDFVKIITDAGISVVAVAVIGYLFHRMMIAHKEERREWREESSKERQTWYSKQERQSERVVQALEKLTSVRR